MEHIILLADEHYFAFPIHCLQGVFIPSEVTEVPCASDAILGVLGQRGHIITIIDMRSFLGLAPFTDSSAGVAVSFEHMGEFYGFRFDRVVEILHLTSGELAPALEFENQSWSKFVSRFYFLQERLIIALDPIRTLERMLHSVIAV